MACRGWILLLLMLGSLGGVLLAGVPQRHTVMVQASPQGSAIISLDHDDAADTTYWRLKSAPAVALPAGVAAVISEPSSRKLISRVEQHDAADAGAVAQVERRYCVRDDL